MKVAVVKLSEIGTGCMSARRFCGNCHECERVDRCEEEEAEAGRKEKIRHKIASLKQELSTLEKLLEDM